MQRSPHDEARGQLQLHGPIPTCMPKFGGVKVKLMETRLLYSVHQKSNITDGKYCTRVMLDAVPTAPHRLPVYHVLTSPYYC